MIAESFPFVFFFPVAFRHPLWYGVDDNRERKGLL